MHLDPTLRTPPAYTHTGCGRTDKEKLRGASRRHHKRQTARCVCVYPSWAVSMHLSIRPARVGSLQKSLVAKKSFRKIVIVHHAADRKLQRETKPHGNHFEGVQRTDYVLLRLGRPQGMPTAACRQSEANERGCCEAQRPGEF